MNNISLKNYPDQEEIERINTPLSLEACRKEGIDPEELLFYPFEAFARPNLQKSVQKLNYDFYESQRKKLLKIARAQYKSLCFENKSRKTSKSNQITEIISNEIQKLKERKLKYISRLVNFKLDGIKNNVDGEKVNDEGKPSTTATVRVNKMSSTSREFGGKIKEFVGSSQKNKERDSKLIEEERKRLWKIMESEKQKIQDSEKRRKLAEARLEEHLKKVKEMREQENLQKLEKIKTKSEKSKQQLLKLEQNRIEHKVEKISKGQMRISRVISLKNLCEESSKQARDNIIKAENEKIEHHLEKKSKTQKNFLDKLKEKNQKHELKSKQTREKIEENLEVKKEKSLKNFYDLQKKLEYFKAEKEKFQDVVKQKNKLKEVERNWNLIRESRKEDFYRNEILNEIKGNLDRVENIKSAREFMQQFRYDLNLKTQARRARIDQELYQMEVKKKIDIDKINNILQDSSDEDLEFYSTK